MGIDDIPAQVGRVIRFSVRSPSSFLLSLFTSVFVIGLATDLVYGFLYTRIYNVKDAVYTPRAWLVLSLIALGLPMASGLYAVVAAYRKLRPFGSEKYGVAIAPFDVFSLDPDVLGTPSKRQALEEVIPQFFNAMLARFRESEWYNLLEFRYLPPFARVNREKVAQETREKLAAELLIWGKIVHKIDAPLNIEINLVGVDTSLKFSGPADPLQMANIFAYFILSAAGYSLMKSGRPSEAIQILKPVRDLAQDVDKTTNSGTTHRDRVDAWLKEAVRAAGDRLDGPTEPFEAPEGEARPS